MKIKLTLITILGLFILNSIKANAQTDTVKISPSHLAAAQELITTTGMTNVRFTQMRNSTINSLSESIPEKNRQKFSDEMKTFMDKYLPSERFAERTLRIYAETFTEDELKQLVSFYNSPLGKKISNKLPEIMQNLMLLDHQVIVQHTDELQSIVTESIK